MGTITLYFDDSKTHVVIWS